MRNGEPIAHPKRTVEKIKAYVEMIMQHSFKLKSAPTTNWSPPPVDSVMLNVDAAIFSDTGRMGAGVVIQNYQGEAKAARWALLTAHQDGHSRVVIASDCLNLVKKINCAGHDRSSIGALVHDIN